MTPSMVMWPVASKPSTHHDNSGILFRAYNRRSVALCILLHHSQHQMLLCTSDLEQLS
jgi:hypothetical protein